MVCVTPLAIRRAAMDLLARREHTQQELLEKLGQKFTRKIAEGSMDLYQDSLVENCSAEGLLSDDSVADSFSFDVDPDSLASIPETSSFDNEVEVYSKDALALRLKPLIIEEIDNLFRENLQSDERFVESFINGRRSAGKGPRVVRQQLKSRGVDEDLVDLYLVDNDPVWFELAEKAYTKKFGKLPPLSYDDKVKRQRFMLYRGFLYEQFSGLMEG